MWHRDETLVRQHTDEVERELRAAALLAEARAATARRPHRGLRAAGIGATRRLGGMVLVATGWLRAGSTKRKDAGRPTAASLATRHHT